MQLLAGVNVSLLPGVNMSSLTGVDVKYLACVCARQRTCVWARQPLNTAIHRIHDKVFNNTVSILQNTLVQLPCSAVGSWENNEIFKRTISRNRIQTSRGSFILVCLRLNIARGTMTILTSLTKLQFWDGGRHVWLTEPCSLFSNFSSTKQKAVGEQLGA